MPSAVVKLSELGPVRPENFEQTVKLFAAEVNSHAAHAKAVADGCAQPYPEPRAAELIARCVRTKANGEVVADFVIEDDRPKPPSETERAATALRSRKAQMINEVAADEHRLVAEVFPEAKKRLLNYRRNDIAKADNARRIEAHVARQNEIAAKAAEMQATMAKVNEGRLAAMKKLQEELQAKGILERLKDAIVGAPLAEEAAPDASIAEALKAVPPTLTPDELEAAAIAGRSAEDAAFVADFDKIGARIDVVARHAAKLHAQIHDLTLETIDAWKPEPFPS